MTGLLRALAALALSASVMGCSAIADFGRYQPRGRVDGSVAPDTGTSDAGTSDAGTSDAGTSDAGTSDAGTSDAGTSDAGAGDCDPACGAAEGCCDGACVPLDTIAACGACGNACADAPNGDPVCVAGACALTCDSGFADCDGVAANGCEQGLIDPEHCGGCDAGCGSGEVCASVGGSPQCRGGCPAGQMQCGGGCFDLDTSVEHCGACDNACTAPVGVTATCVNGLCSFECEPGRGNCDGDTSNGCEAALVTSWTDGDGDGYGAPGTEMETCPGAPNTAPNGDDCDDADPDRNPDKTEVCNGADDDCNGSADDVAGLGGACSCEPGAASGVLGCGTEPAPMCEYPVEECNALDDDCDGVADNGFECAAGTTQTCTTTITGCVATGERTCTTTCSFGACEVRELCNRADDDCDGKVDEGVLAFSAPVSLTSSGMLAVRADVGDGGDVGVVFVNSVGGVHDLMFTVVAPDGVVRFSPVRVDADVHVDPARPRVSADVAWTGSHWAVAYNRNNPAGRDAWVASLRPDGSVVGSTGLVPPQLGDGPQGIRLDRIRASEQVAVAWYDKSGGAALDAARVGFDGSGRPMMLESRRLESSGGARRMEDPDVSTSPSGAVVVFPHFRDGGGGNAELQLAVVTPGSIGTTTPFFLSGPTELEPEVAYDPVSGRLAVVYQSLDLSGLTELRVSLIGPAGPVDTRTLATGSVRWAYVTSANDSGFGVSYALDSGPSFVRVSASDLSEWTSLPTPTGFSRHVIGLNMGRPHYLVFSIAGAGIAAAPVDCL